jgi:uncharacterized protein DUF3592
VKAAGRGAGPRWWRTRRGHVLWPLAIGLAIGALGLWSGIVYQHNQAAFRAQAVRARAVIEQIYDSAPSQNEGAPPTFDQYAILHFEAQGRTAHARVLLVANCSGVCVPTYRVGQILTVDYSRQNLSYAQLPSRLRTPSADFWDVFMALGFLGLIFLAAAVINMLTA